ncbi:outer membrane beta-barrel protein [uncultured Rhodoblastus sp.]|uniref:outer membrane protein n=1 Tax=uncultured Rhodoblastus sp. TaxID=543037 RepID=UPI0025F3A0A5|nr:outer membrane beta-barrel protein [uncultured Rhodoblastus sp.]
MKKVLIAMVGGAALGAASLAQAGDLPGRPYGQSYDAPPSFTWTGFYAGAQLGVGFGGFNGPGAAYFGSSPSGGLIGLTAGYNFQSGNLMVGAEGDYAWSHIADQATFMPGVSSTGVVQNIDTIRARFGYAAERLLAYGTGGYAGANIRGVLNNAPASAVADQTFYANGFTLGVGVEYAITPHITAKAEYLYVSLGTNSYFNSTPNYTSVGTNLNLLRAGVNYKF